MAITALPTPPSRQDPANFAERADDFLGALPTFATEANALADDVNAKQVAASNAATTATTQAGIATAQAELATTNGAAQVALAAIQANNAAASAAAALASEESLKGRWLSAKAGDPSVDDNGDPLVAGISYFNTTLQRVRIYNGAAWQDAVGTITADFTIVREVIVATAGQTVFNLTNSYNVGTNSVMLYLNGVRLLNSDYTETNNSTITLASPAAAGDELLIEIGVVSSGTTAVAGLTSFNPTAGISATNVQEAIAELDTEKQALLVSGTNIKTVNSQSLLGSGNIDIISLGTGGTTATGSVILTAASAGAQSISPSGYGQYVTLPDATTMPSLGGVLFTLGNKGPYPLGIKDAAGNVLGWVPPVTTTIIGLADKSTSAGVWNLTQFDPAAVTAVSANLTAGLVTFYESTQIDSSKTLLLLRDNNTVYAIVHDAISGQFGSRVMVRNVVSGTLLLVTSCLSGANQVLVCTSSATSFEAVTLSISGTTITVNTPATAVVSGVLDLSGNVIKIGDSFVVAYRENLLAMTINGTTVTIGTPVNANGLTWQFASYPVAGSVGIAIGGDGANHKATPFTVSGTTITLGTPATWTNSTFDVAVRQIGSRFIVFAYGLSGLVSVSGTVATVSTWTTSSLDTSDFTRGLFWDCQVSSTKWLYGNNSFARILTDSSGTAVLSNEVAMNSTSLINVVRANSSTVTLYADGQWQSFNGGTIRQLGRQLIQIDVSGSVPVISLASFLEVSLSDTQYTDQLWFARPYSNYCGCQFRNQSTVRWTRRAAYSGAPLVLGLNSTSSVCLNGYTPAVFSGAGVVFRAIPSINLMSAKPSIGSGGDAALSNRALVAFHSSPTRMFCISSSPNGQQIYCVEVAA